MAQLIIQIILYMKSLASIKVAIRIDYFFQTMSYTLSSKGPYSYCYGSLSTGYRARTNESFPLWPELYTPPPWACSRVTVVAISSSPGGAVRTPFLDKGTSSSGLGVSSEAPSTCLSLMVVCRQRDKHSKECLPFL